MEKREREALAGCLDDVLVQVAEQVVSGQCCDAVSNWNSSTASRLLLDEKPVIESHRERRAGVKGEKKGNNSATYNVLVSV